MNEIEKKFWMDSFHRGMDMWILEDRPKVFDEDGDECVFIFDYCGEFADACIEEYRAAIQQANQPDSGE